MSQKKRITNTIKFLPFAFALHNIEEALHICTANPTTTTPVAVSPLQFVIAVSLFTILGFVLIFGKSFYPTPKSYQYAVTGFSGMLFLNSFFPHILSAIYLVTYTAGVISATFLILPLTAWILWQVYKSHIFSKKQFIWTILAGAIIGLALVFLFLGIGYLFVCNNGAV